MSLGVPAARIRNLREAFVKASKDHGRCWVCLTMPEKAMWPKEPHWLELVHPDRLEDDTWGREVWGRTLGYVAGGYRQPFRFEFYDNWAVVFYHSRGILEHQLESMLRMLCEDHINDDREQLDELASEAVACFGLRNDNNPFAWTDDAYKWLWRVFDVLDSTAVLVPMPMGNAQWKVRKLTYNVFQASVVAVDILASEPDSQKHSAIHRERASAQKLFCGKIPENTDLVDLAVRLDNEKGGEKTQLEIARKLIGDEKRAKSLLSQIRRMKREGRLNL